MKPSQCCHTTSWHKRAFNYSKDENTEEEIRTEIMFAVKLKSLIRHDSIKLTKDVYRSVLRSNLVESTRGSGVRCFTSLGNEGSRNGVILAVGETAVARRQLSGDQKKISRSPITWKSFLISLGIGGVFVGYLIYLKNKKLDMREKDRKRILGKARIGGRFELVDHDNKLVKSEDFFGDWLLVYFGFTHCPDICPDEIEKMVEVVNTIDQRDDMKKVKPVFITVDPDRDTPSVVKKYVKEFSEKITGLTGTVEQIAAVCKAFRVYFSPGPKDSDADYIVDHSIIMYLIDPEGNFVDYYGQNKNASQIVFSINFNQVKYEQSKSKNLTQKLQELVFG